MRARCYDPSLGRFANEDPGYNGANWFIYCNDNPVNQVDADGKIPLLNSHDLTAIIDWMIKEAGNNQKLVIQMLARLAVGAKTAWQNMVGGALNLRKGQEKDALGDEPGGKAQQIQGGTQTIGGATDFANDLMVTEELKFAQLELDFGDDQLSLFD